MTERKWTPGPWSVEYDGGYTQLVMGDGDIHMCDMTYYPWVPDNVADWHLIAAAPDMYEALEEAADPICGYLHGPALERARAALTKARGEA